MYYIELNEDGQPTFYVQGQEVPDSAIPIELDQYHAYLEAMTYGKVLVHDDGEIIIVEPEDTRTIADIKTDAIIAINAQFEQAMHTLLSEYTEQEINSWHKQDAEARAFQADPEANTPMIDNIATASGRTKEELVTRILAKAEAFSMASGALIGKRQKLTSAIEAIAEDTDQPTALQMVAANQWSV